MRTLTLPLLAIALHLHAQRAAHAELERAEIRLGEQVLLQLETPLGRGMVQWPAIGDTLTSRVEVVRASPTDTLRERGVARRTLHITAFDTGYWAIPPLRFMVGGKPAETEALLLHVTGVPLDEGGAPRPEKPLIELPFSPLWWARQHAAWIGAALAIAAVAAAVALLMKRKRAAPPPEALAVEPPLHERVLAALAMLERERLWQQGEHKAYQSRLTDLLRGYVEERYQVPALERTTDELMHELRVSTMPPDHQALLGNMLRAADLVKFAKALPSPAENEQLMSSAVRFVRESAAQTTPSHAPRP